MKKQLHARGHGCLEHIQKHIIDIYRIFSIFELNSLINPDNFQATLRKESGMNEK